MKIELTPKQAEYIRNAHHRWNFAVGAVRSGKSHIAIQYVIPSRIRERIGKKGLLMLFGASRENIERNVLSPMRELWGKEAVGEINNRSIVKVFGDTAYCMGLENIGALKRIRGSEIKYAYCDEVCDVNEEVFNLVKSRLSLPYSCFDGCANPEGPRHFVKRFIDTPGLDLYCQTYTLYDNPFIPANYVRDLELEYKGTVNFDRYILGLWKQAEGLVYPFDNESDFTCSYDDARGLRTIKRADGKEHTEEGQGMWYVSIDYGITNPFAAILWRVTPKCAYAVDLYYFDSNKEGKRRTDEEHYDAVDALIDGREIEAIVIDPSATSLREVIKRRGKYMPKNADNDVKNGVSMTNSMLRTGVMKISVTCEALIEEMSMYSWNKKAIGDEVIKEYDHACDAMRYFAYTIMKKILRYGEG